jgi:hypothetical protein
MEIVGGFLICAYVLWLLFRFRDEWLDEWLSGCLPGWKYRLYYLKWLWSGSS